MCKLPHGYHSFKFCAPTGTQLSSNPSVSHVSVTLMIELRLLTRIKAFGLVVQFRLRMCLGAVVARLHLLASFDKRHVSCACQHWHHCDYPMGSDELVRVLVPMGKDRSPFAANVKRKARANVLHAQSRSVYNVHGYPVSAGILCGRSLAILGRSSSLHTAR